jgi:integrase
MEKEIFYIIYKTTNLLNGKYYIGKHKCSSLDDGYLGSGTILNKAIKKYGKENFKRETLFTFDNDDDMNNKEKELITEEMINDPMVYNIHPGGRGGFTLEEAIKGSAIGNAQGSQQKATEAAKLKWEDDEFRKIQTEINKTNGAIGGKIIGDKLRGTTKAPLSIETKERLSDTIKNNFDRNEQIIGTRFPKIIFTVQCPDGEIITTYNLRKWCDDRGLNSWEKRLNKQGYFIISREKITKEMKKDLLK